MSETLASLVVDVTPGPLVRRRLEAARELAASYRSRLVAVCHAWPRTSLLRDALDSVGAATPWRVADLEAALTTTRSIFDEVLDEGRDAVEWCSAIAEPTTGMIDHALTADLVITGAEEDQAYASVDPADVALATGTPVLRFGRDAPRATFERVVVAWKDGREARRALHEALPFLARARSVLVVGVGDEVASRRLEDVSGHLKLHGVAAGHVHEPGGGGAGTQLLRIAREQGADLIVAGAYGHSRSRERILGGVTRDLMASDASWLMAH
ncbi:universal stress protein [Phenylobacterium sp.]|uniref:universal stress protein n=1 Tax=Phenylobacterium sp. TaxID=1871053 RepID=UPI003919375C